MVPIRSLAGVLGNMSYKQGASLIVPLRKRTLNGEIYTRSAQIETKLMELALLSHDEVVAKCVVHNRNDPEYLPSECLVYLVRARRADNSDIYFERLYKILIQRVARCLPKAENLDGKTLSLTKSRIRELALDKFTELLLIDRKDYSDRLDFFEIRFDGALANLRRDAQKQAWREENRSETLELDEETGDLSAAVELAAGSFDPFDAPELDADRYQSRLNAAIDELPLEQGRIVEMIRQGIPIDSKEPDALTIAKVLNKSEKTIRTHRNKAFASLRAALMQGEE